MIATLTLLALLQNQKPIIVLAQPGQVLVHRKPFIPNHYRKNTPVPYMPGAGQPLIDREEPKLQSLLVRP
jgi:hypothetical protein